MDGAEAGLATCWAILDYSVHCAANLDEKGVILGNRRNILSLTVGY